MSQDNGAHSTDKFSIICRAKFAVHSPVFCLLKEKVKDNVKDQATSRENGNHCRILLL